MKKVEELSLPNEVLDKTKHDKIFVLNDSYMTDEVLKSVLDNIDLLRLNTKISSVNEAREVLSKILPDYNPQELKKEHRFDKLNDKAEA